MKLKIPYNLGEKTLSVRDKVEMFLGRLKTISPSREASYRYRAMKLLADIEEFQALYPEWKKQQEEREKRNEKPEDIFLTNTHFSVDPLMDIPDTGRTTYPENCAVKQLVIQAPPRIKTDRLYQIHISSFVKLDNDSIAMMVTHEAIIPEGYSSGHTDTRMSRFMNVTIASDVIKSWTEKQWFDHLSEIGFGYMEKDGLTITVSDYFTKFDDVGRLRYAMLPKFDHIEKDGDKETLVSYQPSDVRFDENGKKLAFTLNKKDQFGDYSKGTVTWKIKDLRDKTFYAFQSIGFHSNGKFRYFRPVAYGCCEKNFYLKFRGLEVKLDVRSSTIFSSSDGTVIGYSNAHREKGGSTFETGLPPEEFLQENAIDKFIDDQNLPRPYILRLVNPTFRGKPLLYSADGYYTFKGVDLNICKVLGFGETLNYTYRSIDGGEAYHYVPGSDEKPGEWQLESYKNVNPVTTFLNGPKDAVVLNELICVK